MHSKMQILSSLPAEGRSRPTSYVYSQGCRLQTEFRPLGQKWAHFEIFKVQGHFAVNFQTFGTKMGTL